MRRLHADGWRRGSAPGRNRACGVRLLTNRRDRRLGRRRVGGRAPLAGERGGAGPVSAGLLAVHADPVRRLLQPRPGRDRHRRRRRPGDRLGGDPRAGGPRLARRQPAAASQPSRDRHPDHRDPRPELRLPRLSAGRLPARLRRARRGGGLRHRRSGAVAAAARLRHRGGLRTKAARRSGNGSSPSSRATRRSTRRSPGRSRRTRSPRTSSSTSRGASYRAAPDRILRGRGGAGRGGRGRPGGPGLALPSTGRRGDPAPPGDRPRLCSCSSRFRSSTSPAPTC